NEAELQLCHSSATGCGCSMGITEHFRPQKKGRDHERAAAHENNHLSPVRAAAQDHPGRHGRGKALALTVGGLAGLPAQAMTQATAPTAGVRAEAAIPFTGHPSSPNGSSGNGDSRSEEHTSELQSRFDLVCRLLLEK